MLVQELAVAMVGVRKQDCGQPRHQARLSLCSPHPTDAAAGRAGADGVTSHQSYPLQASAAFMHGFPSHLVYTVKWVKT